MLNEKTGLCYYLIVADDIIIIGISSKIDNSVYNCFVIFKLSEIFKSYLGKLTEYKFKDNFSSVYLILDEAFTNGFVTLFEKDSLKALVYKPNIATKLKNVIIRQNLVSEHLPKATESQVCWRSRGLKYQTNEILVDLIEYVNITIKNSKVVVAYLNGQINVCSSLSDMPEVCIRLTNIEKIDDYTVHKCVKLHRFENEKTLAFLPPDEDFVLFKYSILNIDEMKILNSIPVYVKPQISYFFDEESYQSYGKLSVVCGKRANGSNYNTTIKDLQIKIQLPKGTMSIELVTKIGNYEFDMTKKILLWNIGDIVNDLPKLEGKIKFDFRVGEINQNLCAQLFYTLQGNTISNIEVNNLSIFNVGYKPFKGYKNIVKAGKVDFRF